MNKKPYLISEYANLLFFWFVGVCYFFLFRLFFISWNHSDISNQAGLVDFIKGIYMGFRFDITVIFYFIAIPLLSTFILVPLKKYDLSKKIRIFFQRVFTILSVLISVVTLNYYKEYKDQFNQFLFMGIYDDKKAVFQTVIKEFHPIWNTILILTLVFCLFKVFKIYESKIKIETFLNRIKFKFRDLVFSFLMLAFVVITARGSFNEYPVRRFYSSITSDDLINKAIVNPFRALIYAIEDYKELNGENAKNPYRELPKSAHKFATISELISKKNPKKILSKAPNQIFLVVMESYDSWPLKKVYKDLGVSSKLRELQEKGVRFTNFLPSAHSTMVSFGAVITGIPYAGINMSIIGSTYSYPSSIFNQFKNLGYETNFFYGGYLSWQNIKNFTERQGAENIYGGGMKKGNHGIWGVDDETLFKTVLEKVDPTKKSLNVILTTSYHPPFEVDLDKEGFPYKSVEDLPKKYEKLFDENKMSLKALGHLWYSDKMIGEFVKKAEQKYKSSIYAFTGDHYGRRFMNGNPTLYERSSVPFILYGKPINKIKGFNKTPGSHIDIIPTLIELVAPENYSYYSFGCSLWNKSESSLGIAYNKVIDTNILQEFSSSYGVNEQILIKKDSRKIVNFRKEHDSLLSLAWYYSRKGDSIKFK